MGELLQEAIGKCKSKGILVLCDEIMCGLGRHGHGTLFLSKAWELEPDAVTFGKSVAAGPFPMSGVAIKHGASLLGLENIRMTQSHTYAGSSALALLTAREVLLELPKWLDHAKIMGDVIVEVLGPVNDGEFLQINGQGLMWGGLLMDPSPDRKQEALAMLREECRKEGVWPYFVQNGFMLSPPMDIEEAELREGLMRLLACLEKVRTKFLPNEVQPWCYTFETDSDQTAQPSSQHARLY